MNAFRQMIPRGAMLDSLRESRAEGRTATTTQRSGLPSPAERALIDHEKALHRERRLAR